MWGRGLLLTDMNREFPLLRAAHARADAKPRLVLPPNAPGMRIGLFGGTFDPPHAAHRAACLLAMKRLGLGPGLVAGHAGQSAQGHRRFGAACRPRAGGAAALRAIRASTLPVSRRRSAHPTPTRPSNIWCGVVRRFTSSGSWARIICAASIAGSAGAASPGWCQLRWSTGLARAFMPRQGSPVRRLLTPAFLKRRPRRCRNEPRQPGFICMGSSRRCRRRRCGRHAHCYGSEAGASCTFVATL